ncbi:hypothetical protein AB0H40_24740, partial [Streptomyces filamentosus]
MRLRPGVPRRPSVAAHLAGALAARTGDEASGPALALVGFAAAGSASRAGTLLACATVSAAVGGPALGSLLDRSRRPGRLLAGAFALHAAGLCGVLLGHGRRRQPVEPRRVGELRRRHRLELDRPVRR